MENFPVTSGNFLRFIILHMSDHGVLAHGFFLRFWVFCLMTIFKHVDVQIHSTIVNSYQGQTSLVKTFHSLSFLFYKIKSVKSQLVKHMI